MDRNLQVLVDLLGITVLSEESSENSHSADPDDLGGQTGITSTLSLTGTGVSSLSLGEKVLSDSGAGVDHLWLTNDQTILDQLSDVLTYSRRKENT